MRYLAEVQKQTKLFGLGQTELKLLAKRKANQSWSALPVKVVIPAIEANHLNAGVLVFVDLNRYKQVQRIQEATPTLVNTLLNFSRQLQNPNSREAQLELLKQSLTYQTEELNRREAEIAARLEHQLQEIEQQRQKLELERKELEKAWEFLGGKERQPRANDAVLGGQNHARESSMTELGS